MWHILNPVNGTTGGGNHDAHLPATESGIKDILNDLAS
jgi:hypothetical protein